MGSSVKIDTVGARDKLAPRRTPYWHRLDTGRSLGFRKLSEKSPGTWLLRAYNPDTGKDVWKSLGSFEDRPANERFSAAKAAADALADHAEAGGDLTNITVADACARYVKHLEDEGRAAAAKSTKQRFTRWIDNHPLGKTALRRLHPERVKEWRQQLAKKDVVINPHADSSQERTRPRSASTVDRDVSSLRAALNLAKRHRLVTTDAAWLDELAPSGVPSRRRDAYLDRKQRADLIGAAAPDVALLLRGLATLPLRPGALAALKVGDFDARLRTLRVGTDKAGAERRITLPPATVDFLVEQARSKLPAAHLFTRADGKGWTKDCWKGPIKAAAAAAGLPDSTVAYSLRHSAITDLVVGGLDLFTVAKLAGTSVAMIEKFYGHLQAGRAAAALATLAL